MGKTPDNIYHCCVFKTGSQWVRAILEHPLIYKASGLECYRYEDYLPGKTDTRNITQRSFDEAFPQKKILSPLFLSYECFKAIQKPDNYSVFFVARDPRDIITSMYYSILYSHREMGRISEMRSILKAKTKRDGLAQVVDWSRNESGGIGLFAALNSWSVAEKSVSDFKIFRFEDLTGKEQFDYFKMLMVYCRITISDTDLQQVLSDLSFQKLSGRNQGQENLQSHYRKGMAGDWKNHFDTFLENYFIEKSENLVEKMGYA